jgi:hypothetical protein
MFEREQGRKPPRRGTEVWFMRERKLLDRALAGCLALAMSGALAPLHAAAAGTATVSGTILSVSDRSPLAGARLYLGDPATGDVFPSAPADPDGKFVVAELPPATYEVAVGLDRGLYLVPERITLASGAERTLALAVDPETPPVPPSDPPDSGLGLWSNPLTAALLVLGSALVVGAAVESATDDEDDASPTNP